MSCVIEKSEWWDRVHVVLVEPGESRNVGSVARAMDNLGFHHLHLVAPPRYDAERAAQTACWATPLLHTAARADSLGEVLAPMTEVVGFSTRGGKNRPPLLDLPTWVGEVIARGAPEKLALVFGPEDTGLTQEHVAHCRVLVRIPSRAANPAFNLAQSVLLVLYELTRIETMSVSSEETVLAQDGTVEPGTAEGGTEHGAAKWAEFQQLDEMIDTIARRTDFYHDGTPPDLPHLIRNLFRRTRASSREAQILLGLFGRIIKTLSKSAS